MALVMVCRQSFGVPRSSFSRFAVAEALVSAGAPCHPSRDLRPSDRSGPAIHGRAFANAVDADRASTRRVRSPLIPPAAEADGGEDHRDAGGRATPQMEAGE